MSKEPDDKTKPKPESDSTPLGPKSCGGCVFLIPAAIGDVARCRCQPPIVYRIHSESVYPAVILNLPCGEWTDKWPER
jgi:hypothetical protein